MEIYGDIYLFLNWACDFFILTVACCLLKRRRKKRRLLLSSLIGGVYSLFSLYISELPAVNMILAFLSSVLIVFAAFGFQNLRTFLYDFAFFYLSAFLIGGFNEAVFQFFLLPNLSPPYAVLLLALLFSVASLFTLALGKALTKRFANPRAELFFSWGGKNYDLTAFCDSGNLMKDEKRNLPVVLVSSSVFGSTLPVCRRSVTMKTVTGASAFPVLEPDILKVNGKERKASVVISIGAQFDGCPALIPTILLL